MADKQGILHAELRIGESMSYDDDTKRIIRLHDRIKDLERKIVEAAAEIERLRAERAGDQQRLFHYEGQIALLVEAAAFLDRLADVMTTPGAFLHAAECRAMAARLRGET